MNTLPCNQLVAPYFIKEVDFCWIQKQRGCQAVDRRITITANVTTCSPLSICYQDIYTEHILLTH